MDEMKISDEIKDLARKYEMKMDKLNEA